jgi:tetratricopeptide (TPR) repeat protein
MHDSVYGNPALIESLSTFKCVAVDAGVDTALSKEHGIVVYPTMVFTDAYGGERGRMIGYHSPEEFLARLGTVRRSKERLSELFRSEESYSEDPAFLLSFGRMLLEMGMYEAALIRFDRAMRVDQDPGFDAIEESEYSLAECYMLSGSYREAGRRFRIFAERFPESGRNHIARILAGICYQKAGYTKVATGIYEDYLEDFKGGAFASFAGAMLDSLDRENRDES